jgi:hypothetical protein
MNTPASWVVVGLDTFPVDRLVETQAGCRSARAGGSPRSPYERGSFANVTDPDAYLLGGGVVEAAPKFREWFLSKVRENTLLHEEQARLATFALMPDLDMAGAGGVGPGGAAVAALETVHTGQVPAT